MLNPYKTQGEASASHNISGIFNGKNLLIKRKGGAQQESNSVRTPQYGVPQAHRAHPERCAE
jgi:hypothetical protein